MSEKIVCSHCGKKTAKLLKCQICGSPLPEEDLGVDASAILADVDTILEAEQKSGRVSSLRVKRDVVGASNPENPADMIAINPAEKTLFADEEEDLISGIEELADSADNESAPASPDATSMPESPSTTMKSSKDSITTPLTEDAAPVDQEATEQAKGNPQDPVQPEQNMKPKLEPFHFKEKENSPAAEVEPPTTSQKLTARLAPMKAESAKPATPETEPKTKTSATAPRGGLKPRDPAPLSRAKNDTKLPDPRKEKPEKAKTGMRMKPESSLEPAPPGEALMAEESSPPSLSALDDKA